jgi:hypothetical protein
VLLFVAPMFPSALRFVLLRSASVLRSLLLFQYHHAAPPSVLMFVATMFASHRSQTFGCYLYAGMAPLVLFAATQFASASVLLCVATYFAKTCKGLSVWGLSEHS